MSASVDTEVQWLRATILPLILKSGKFVENYAESAADTFKVLDIEVKFISAEEAFMLTTCYRAVVSYEFAGVAGTRTLFVKKTPRLPQEMFDSINFAALFGNEINAYESIMPAIEKFAEREFDTPKFYCGELQKDFASIVFEDFGGQGWRVTKERANLSLEHVLLAVKYLAAFHGAGFALRQQQRTRFDELSSLLRESRYASSVIHPDFNLMMETAIVRMLQVTLQLQPQVQEQFLQRLAKLLNKPFRYGKQLVQPVEPMITLCHGDFLRNNVAYKYGEGEKAESPQAVMMFDLQTMRESSPMLDLAIFLQLSAFARVRHTHFAHIFSTYCRQLAATFEAHSSTAAPQFLSEESLLQEYVRFLPYAISITAGFLPALVELKDMSSEEMLLEVRTQQDVIDEAMTRGGATVDAEVAHQVKELYELSVQHDVDVFKGFDA